MLQQAVYNSALAFTSCFCRSSKLATGYRPFQVFPEYVHSPVHALVLLEIQKYVRAFESPYRTPIFQFFLLSFLMSLLLVSSGSTVSGICKLKQLC